MPPVESQRHLGYRLRRGEARPPRFDEADKIRLYRCPPKRVANTALAEAPLTLTVVKEYRSLFGISLICWSESHLTFGKPGPI
jgi:hypothetical protein